MKDNESIRADRPENLMILPKGFSVETPQRKVAKETRERNKKEQTISGWQELAFCVVLQAWTDAVHWRDSYNRAASRRFLTGETREWRQSLEDWCGVAKKDPRLVMEKARARFWDKDKIEKYKQLGR